MTTPGRPGREEFAPYYSRYIDLVQSDDVVGVLEAQLRDTTALLGAISEDRSRHRYAPDKWSLREMLSHVSDTERVFAARAFWFARGIPTPLPDFDQDPCARAARADEIPWARHVEEFRVVREGTLALLRNLFPEAWSRTGVASGNTFTVRAMAYIAAGHVAHHLAVLKDKYS